MKCVITGCALIGHDGRWIAGDLFDGGSQWVFNGNYRIEGLRVKPEWIDDEELHYEKHLQPDDWFEKRSVFVVDKSKANLNEAAVRYIAGQWG